AQVLAPRLPRLACLLDGLHHGSVQNSCHSSFVPDPWRWLVRSRFGSDLGAGRGSGSARGAWRNADGGAGTRCAAGAACSSTLKRATSARRRSACSWKVSELAAACSTSAAFCCVTLSSCRIALLI